MEFPMCRAQQGCQELNSGPLQAANTQKRQAVSPSPCKNFEFQEGKAFIFASTGSLDKLEVGRQGISHDTCHLATQAWE